MKNIKMYLFGLTLFSIAMPLRGMEDPKDLRRKEFFGIPKDIGELIKENPLYFEGMSESDQKILCIEAASMLRNTTIKMIDDNVRKQRLLFILNTFIINPQGCSLSAHFHEDGDGYLTCSNLALPVFCSGKRYPLSVNDFTKNKNSPDILKSIVDKYTIQLMPEGPMIDDVDQLITLINNDSDLGKAIAGIALHYCFHDTKSRNAKTKNVLPKIVILCAQGKQNAQTVLNKIYAAFKDKEGLNVTPRYSQKITSYISYTQGEGEYKGTFPTYFKQPGMILYRDDVITGEKVDYCLSIPQGYNV